MKNVMLNTCNNSMLSWTFVIYLWEKNNIKSRLSDITNCTGDYQAAGFCETIMDNLKIPYKTSLSDFNLR
jgi:hypothetical protein